MVLKNKKIKRLKGKTKFDTIFNSSTVFKSDSLILWLSKNEKIQHAWTTSWGVSTRLIGGIIMTHSDDDGLICPPAIAPQQVVILPIYKTDEQRTAVLAQAKKIQNALKQSHNHTELRTSSHAF